MRHIVALRHNGDATRHMAQNGRKQERVVRASQHQSVDVGVDAQDFFDAFLHEIVGSGTVKFAIFHQRHPHRTSQTSDGDVGEEFFYLQIVASGANSSLCCHNPHMSRVGDVAQSLHRGTNNPQHAFVGSERGEVVLLNGAQCLCRSGVARQNHEFATAIEEFAHRF